jgi:hypothetical protein
MGSPCAQNRRATHSELEPGIAVSDAAVVGRKVESRTSALAGHHGGLADVELLCGPATLARTLKKTDGFNGNRRSLDWNMCFRPSPRD